MPEVSNLPDTIYRNDNAETSPSKQQQQPHCETVQLLPKEEVNVTQPTTPSDNGWQVIAVVIGLVELIFLFASVGYLLWRISYLSAVLLKNASDGAGIPEFDVAIARDSGYQATDKNLQVTMTTYKSDLTLTSQFIAFEAFHDEGFTAALGTIIKHPRVALNNGDGYNATSGVFTAPVRGIYDISYTHLGECSRLYLCCNLVHDNKIVSNSCSQYAFIASKTDIIHMESGDQVWVQSAAIATQCQRFHQYGYTTFLGYIVREL